LHALQYYWIEVNNLCMAMIVQNAFLLSSPAMKAFCTIITGNFSNYAIALHQSIARFTDVPMEVLVVDESSKALPAEESDMKIRFTTLAPMLFGDTGAAIIRKYHDLQDALRWSLKSVWLTHLLERKGYDSVIFLDPVFYFFQDPSFLFDDLNKGAMLLSPHWRSFNPNTDPINFELNFRDGMYNGGCIGANQMGIPSLKWFANACLYACEHSRERGLFMDQKYLDALSVQFEGIRILRHKGCNIANWNMVECQRTIVGGRLLINSTEPIVFVHFTQSTIRGVQNGADPLLAPLLEEYIQAVGSAGADQIRISQPHGKRASKQAGVMRRMGSKLFSGARKNKA
jgi:hypothetical protein